MKKVILFFLLGVQFLVAQEFALVRQGKKFGYINQKGEFVIQPKYDLAKNFSDGLAAVREGDLFGFINVSGEWVI